MSKSPAGRYRGGMTLIREMPVGSFLEALDSLTPTPGGGAVAGMIGATSAALAGMVIHYSYGKKSLVSFQDHLTVTHGQLRALRAELLALADEDAQAYGQYSTAAKLDAGDPQRPARMLEATRACINVPMRTLAAVDRLAALLADLPGKSSKPLRSDLAIAAMLCESAARACRCNIAINLPHLRDDAERTAHRTVTDERVDAVVCLVHGVIAACV